MAIHKITLSSGQAIFLEEDHCSLQLGVIDKEGRPTYALEIDGVSFRLYPRAQQLLQDLADANVRRPVSPFASRANCRVEEVRFGQRIGAFLAPRDGWVWFDERGELFFLQVYPTREEAEQELHNYTEELLDHPEWFLRRERPRGRPRPQTLALTVQVQHDGRSPTEDLVDLLSQLLRNALAAPEVAKLNLQTSKFQLLPAEPTHEPATPPPGGPTPAAPDAPAGGEALSDLGPRQ